MQLSWISVYVIAFFCSFAFLSHFWCHFYDFFASLCSHFEFFWLSGHIWLYSVVVSPLFVVIQCNFMAVLRLILVFCATLNLK